MTLSEAKAKKVVKAVIQMKMGKSGSLVCYFSSFADYIDPQGHTKITAIISDNIVRDTITESYTKVYTTFNELNTDYHLLKSLGYKGIKIVEV